MESVKTQTNFLLLFHAPDRWSIPLRPLASTTQAQFTRLGLVKKNSRLHLRKKENFVCEIWAKQNVLLNLSNEIFTDSFSKLLKYIHIPRLAKTFTSFELSNRSQYKQVKYSWYYAISLIVRQSAQNYSSCYNSVVLFNAFLSIFRCMGI